VLEENIGLEVVQSLIDNVKLVLGSCRQSVRGCIHIVTREQRNEEVNDTDVLQTGAGCGAGRVLSADGQNGEVGHDLSLLFGDL
jgi:hypothetical protein